MPPADMLIHAGDFSYFSRRRSQIRDFNEWLGELPHRFKIAVPGNHEYALEADPRMRDAISNAVLLIDERVEVEGLRIWGSPVTPLYGGAFGMSKSEDRKRHWAQVPEGTDILITHAAPDGILDHAPGTQVHAGCPFSGISATKFDRKLLNSSPP